MYYCSRHRGWPAPPTASGVVPRKAAQHWAAAAATGRAAHLLLQRALCGIQAVPARHPTAADKRSAALGGMGQQSLPQVAAPGPHSHYQ